MPAINLAANIAFDAYLVSSAGHISTLIRCLVAIELDIKITRHISRTHIAHVSGIEGNTQTVVPNFREISNQPF